MTSLRQRTPEDVQVRRLSPFTQRAYVVDRTSSTNRGWFDDLPAVELLNRHHGLALRDCIPCG